MGRRARVRRARALKQERSRKHRSDMVELLEEQQQQQRQGGMQHEAKVSTGDMAASATGLGSTLTVVEQPAARSTAQRCSICLEEFSATRKGGPTVWKRCVRHRAYPPNTEPHTLFCVSCIQDYARSAITNRNVDAAGRIVCPCNTCSTVLSNADLGQLPVELQAKLQRIRQSLAVENDPSRFWCPVSTCSKAVKITTESWQVRCTHCKTDICVTCGQKAHSWFVPCKPNADRLLDMWRIEQDVRGAARGDGVQPCPYCNRLVEKQGGCMHMSCVCGREFCWRCAGPWDAGCVNGQNGSCERKALLRAALVQHQRRVLSLFSRSPRQLLESAAKVSTTILTGVAGTAAVASIASLAYMAFWAHA